MARRGVNKVIIVGNVGIDPVYKTFDNGGALCNLTIATSETWKDKRTGEDKEKTEWHNVVFRNRLAEIVNQYVKKGGKIYVEGKLETRKYTDKENIERYITEVVGLEMQMLDSRRESGGQSYHPPTSPQPAMPPIDDDDIPY